MRSMQKGQSLFELIVALVVVSISLIALVSLVVKATSNSTVSRNQTFASKYLDEAREWIRGQRDTDTWTTFTNRATSVPSGVYCLGTLAWDPGGCGAGEFVAGTFNRQVQLVYVPAENAVYATIVIWWVEPSGTKESRVTTVLTNWRAN